MPKEPEDYRELAQERGFEWLGPEVVNTHTKTNWRCPQGHEWPARYDKIRQGTGCPECANLAKIGRSLKPKEPEDYRKLAEERGFEWLGPEVVNVHIKTKWRCPQGHEWPACYGLIQQGGGCPECAGVKPKEPEDYRKLAEERGFEWLGPEMANIQTKTKWRCSQGHEWTARYCDIQQGRGCPECAGLKPKEPEDYRKLAEERGFEWLGPEVVNTHTKTKWRCPQGHEWPARYDLIRCGRGCPECASAKN